MKLEFSQHIIEKYSNINFHENLPIGSQAVSCGRNRHHIATSSFPQFSKVPKVDFAVAFLFPALSKDTALQKYA
jgi:hypothetical protein